jgi:hypothetical protein
LFDTTCGMTSAGNIYQVFPVNGYVEGNSGTSMNLRQFDLQVSERYHTKCC